MPSAGTLREPLVSKVLLARTTAGVRDCAPTQAGCVAGTPRVLALRTNAQSRVSNLTDGAPRWWASLLGPEAA
eukprot:385433-Alexandrium_andersonii.AAC.1